MEDPQTKKKAVYADLLNHPILSVEEEIRLVYEAQDGSEHAKDRLVLHNIRGIANVCRGYATPEMPEHELYSLGIEAFQKCIKKFDPVAHTNMRLLTYSIRSIHTHLRQSRDLNKGVIGVPPYVRQANYKINTFLNKINPTEFTLEELVGMIGNETNLSSRLIEFILTKYEKFTTLSRLDEIPYGADSAVTENISDPEDHIQSVENKVDVEILLRCLDSKEREIVRIRYGLDPYESYEEISHRWGVSKASISRMYVKSMEKLRAYARTLEENDLL